MNEQVLKVLQQDVERAFQVKLNENTRRRDVVNGRIAFGYIARTHLKTTLRLAGDCIGKDHATVLHYVKSFEGVYRYDDNFRTLFDKLNIDDYLLRNRESIEEEIDRLKFKIYYLTNRLENAV